MKDRVREAVFNLIGPPIKGTHAVDLFAGTGALALESISRGSISAIAIERHFPTAKIIRENAASLSLGDVVEVYAGDTFFWARDISGLPSETPWAVYCCPPYVLYEERRDDMVSLITKILETAPTDSRVIVEADQRFDYTDLPQSSEWDVRSYHPAVIGMFVKS